MAAGRHGGYRDNEIRERESKFELSRRDFAASKDDYERIRNGNRDLERGRVRDARDMVRARQKDIKEREGMNGGHRVSSSRSDSGSSSGGAGSRGPKRCAFSVKAVDREPGELSSESGSDDAIESDLQVKDAEVQKVVENGTRSPAERKRKFSPIIWDRDDKKEVSRSAKSRIATAVKDLPPPPPLPKVFRQSVIPDGSVQISPINNSQNENLQSSSPVKPPVELEVVDDLIESPVRLSSVSPKQNWGNEQEAEQLEDDDYVPTHNISSSRWAAGNNSPGDEGEILDDEEMPKRRKMHRTESVEASVRNKSLTPELGELNRYGSDRARVRSSEADERGTQARSSSGDDYPENELEDDDYMEVDGEHNQNDTSLSKSDTDSEDEDDYRQTPEPAAPPQRCVDMLQGCRSVDEFERLNKIDEGTYGVVYRAKDKKTGEVVALKKVKMEKEREGFPLTSLREINILLSFHHPSIVDVKEVVVGSNLDSIFMVMEYMEHDLKGLMETMRQPFSQSEVKCLMLQLLEGIKYLHDNWVLHRDLKTSNLLLNNRGEMKICDFGLARQYGSPLKPYTHLVVTLWYR